ncbi:hypothetical protein [Cognatilysobacter lacus]|uniref:Uncharacterized protein n=1 Tax=Cognatilysobacter lacus TaxID=1643323 RepID=A0A5D8YX29_9GAMM|nr:hypothetical protein [Lysobacter lacus]TZF85104.1 hypothetical protein FW784_12580 [Lysobacter lacus]
MLHTATLLFVLTALGGILMAGIRFARKQNPPAWIAMVHGLLAASAMTLLAYSVFTEPVPTLATVALVLFVLAAGGGAVMSLVYKWHHRLLPSWLVGAHATLAVAALLSLLMGTYGGG